MPPIDFENMQLIQAGFFSENDTEKQLRIQCSLDSIAFINKHDTLSEVIAATVADVSTSGESRICYNKIELSDELKEGKQHA